MKLITELAHDHVRSVLREGQSAVDATVGNGFDTLFLLKCVGPSGVVYGFDVQSAALQITAQKLSVARADNVVLLNRSHAEMEASLIEQGRTQVHAVMFNLGYLPGGDKSQITRLESTIPAVKSALQLLAQAGILTVVSYVGHAGGREETEAIESVLKDLPRAAFEVLVELPDPNRIAAPRLFVVKKIAR